MTECDFADDTRITIVKQPGGTSEVRLLLGDKQVSRVVIIPMLMRIGAAVVRMDGVGGVDTEEGYRYRGYARRVMETVVAQIKAGDAALATLFGIQDFYQKFGFDTAGPEHTIIVPYADESPPPSLPAGWQFRSLGVADLPAVMALYHINTRRATGALVRHDAGENGTETERLAGADSDARRIGMRAWNRLSKLITDPGDDACRVLLDAWGQIAAYAWFGANWWMGVRRRDLPRAFHLAEGMARDAESADALLSACRLWAEETGSNYDAVALAIPPEGPVASAAAYQGGEMRAVYTRGGDFMCRMLDADRLLQQLLPELTLRVQATRQPFQRLLTFATDEGEATIVISPDGVEVAGGRNDDAPVVALPQSALARLCLGGFDPEDVLMRLPRPPDTALRPLLCLLFPRRRPHIYPMDRF
jgi:GNAT superfamily N-acetyltransferase